MVDDLVARSVVEWADERADETVATKAVAMVESKAVRKASQLAV